MQTVPHGFQKYHIVTEYIDDDIILYEKPPSRENPNYFHAQNGPYDQ